MKAHMHKVAAAIWVVLGLLVFLCLLGASFGAGGWLGVLLLLLICGFLGWSYTDKKKKPEAPTHAPKQAQPQDEELSPTFSAPARPEVPLLHLPDVSDQRRGSRNWPAE
jgi:hypothetical protein